MELRGLIVMFLSAVGTLILTAPIHCRESIGEVMASDVVQTFSKSVLMKKLTHLHSEWPEGEYIFKQTWIFRWTIPLMVLGHV